MSRLVNIVLAASLGTAALAALHLKTGKKVVDCSVASSFVHREIRESERFARSYGGINGKLAELQLNFRILGYTPSEAEMKCVAGEVEKDTDYNLITSGDYYVVIPKPDIQPDKSKIL